MTDRERFDRESQELKARHMALLAKSSGKSAAHKRRTAKRIEAEVNALLARWGLEYRLKADIRLEPLADGQHRHGDH